MMKFKVNDKVRIVTSKDGISGWNYEGGMDHWLGKIMTIKEVNENDGRPFYKMVEDSSEYGDGWFWYEEMIECKTNYQVGDKVRVKRNLLEDYRFPSVTDGMLRYRGKTYIIDRAWESNNIQLLNLPNTNGWNWADWMVEPVYGNVTENVVENGGVTVNRCACCGREITDGEEMFETVSGDYICEECVNDYYTQCEDCGYYFHNENDNYYVTSGGEHICEGCYDNDYFTCANCGEIEHLDYSRETPSGDYYCEECFNENCSYCEECDEVMWNDDSYYDEENDRYLCESCYHENVYSSIIMGYHEFSDWELQTTGNETKYSLVPMGIELEVEKTSNGVECGDMAKQCRDILGDLAVYERDGSLNHGFEMITQPMTYDYWMNGANDKITQTLNLLKDNGYKSHDTTTCGLHIHVGRESLPTSTRSTDDVIDNIILIMETFKAELTAFSRRNSSQIDRWAHFLTSETSEVSLDYVKELKTTEDRYLALNLKKGATIEFRIFKGSLIKETVYASLELVKNIVNIAKFEKLDGLTWNDIICYHKSVNKYLTQYNQSRGITSETKLCVLDKFDMNKEYYSLENFLQGKFSIKFNQRSDYEQIFLNGLLFMNGIRKFEKRDTDGWCHDRVNGNFNDALRIVSGRGYGVKIENGEAKFTNATLSDSVPLNKVLRLWSENKELLQCA